MAQFGQRLAELRKEAGLTQAALAAKSELSKGAIADFEQGRREPSWATVQALCKALGVKCAAFEEQPAKRKSK